MHGETIDISVVSVELIAGIMERIDLLMDSLMTTRPGGRLRVGIMGESGSGKTVLAHALARAALAGEHDALVIQLDDYFRLPPRDNEARRRQDLGWVGPGEVDLARLDGDLARIAAGATSIDKPLVDFPGNAIMQETMDVTGVSVVIAEGTYVGALQNIDFRIFIDRTHDDTREARLARGREAQSAWLDSVLAIEHEYIYAYKSSADLVINKYYEIDDQVNVK